MTPPIDFIRMLYGDQFPGFLVLWSKQTKLSRYYAAAELDDLAQAIADDASKQDLYLALGTQKERLLAEKRGAADTVRALPGFVADIDFASAKNSTKTFPHDKADALAILGTFPLKPTAIVDTGNGLHVHWLLSDLYATGTARERAMAKRIWTAFQRSLVAHFRQRDRDIDSVGDLTRNFRIPGTFNHKGPAPKPVQLVAMEVNCRYTIEQIRALVDAFLDPVFDRAAQRRDVRQRQSDHAAIVESCSWYRKVVVEGAATCDEPNWYAGASITARCADGEAIFHQYSQLHATYREQDAAEKLKRAGEEAGPRTCKAVEFDLGHSGCRDCPFHGRITSPVQLGHRRRRAYQPGQDGPIPLGHDGADFIFRHQQTKEVMRRTAHQIASTPGLLELAPKEFWEAHFPRLGQRGALLGIDHVNAADALIQACRNVGHLDLTHVRGTGVWIEAEEVVVNLGGKEIESSEFVYTARPRRLDLAEGDVPMEAILSFLRTPNWATPSAPELLLGACAAGVICGALDWRPHIGITGPAQSGKSTIMTGVAHLLSPMGLVVEGISTEAGVRQKLGSDALPVVMDEFEVEGYADLGRLHRLMKLMRSSSSATGEVVRGTPDGRGHTFVIRALFIVAAINLYRTGAADATRLVRLEMRQPDNPRETGERIRSLREAIKDCGPRFCHRAIALAPAILASIPKLHRALPVAQERQADNLATLLAGYAVMMEGREITDDEARQLAAEHAPAVDAQGEAIGVDDATEALNILLGHVVDVPVGNTIEPVSLGLHIAALLSDERGVYGIEAVRAINALGIKLEPPGFLVANSHPGLTGVYRNTRWADGMWGSALARLPGAEKATQRRFTDGVRSLAVLLPGNVLPEPPKPNRIDKMKKF